MIVQRLRDAGVQLADTAPPAPHGPLVGKVFVFTGELASMPRSKAQELVRSLGAETSETVSRKVTTVVAGASAGSKMNKAAQLGLEILDEQQFLALVAQET